MNMNQKPVTITKEKIANQLKKQFGLSSLICEEIVTTVFSELLQITKDTKKTTLQNFGTWKVNHKNSRPGFNVKTGDSVPIKARNVLSFTPAETFKKQINKTDVD